MASENTLLYNIDINEKKNDDKKRESLKAYSSKQRSLL